VEGNNATIMPQAANAADSSENRSHDGTMGRVATSHPPSACAPLLKAWAKLLPSTFGIPNSKRLMFRPQKHLDELIGERARLERDFHSRV
jgi:hypothetical protein